MSRHRHCRIPPSPCPGCGKVQDSATGINAGRVRPGAYMICFNCAALNVLGADGRLREPTAGEAFALWASDTGPLVARAIAAVRGSIAERGRAAREDLTTTGGTS